MLIDYDNILVNYFPKNTTIGVNYYLENTEHENREILSLEMGECSYGILYPQPFQNKTFSDIV